MILDFRDEWLPAFFVKDTRSRHPSELESQLLRKLQMIDDATTDDQDLRVPPGNHFEKLRGTLAGFHSIRVNNQWRLILGH